MNQQANYFKLGLFVIVTTIATLIGVAVLGVADQFKQSMVVETYLFESVEGLSVGSEVKHLGVTIGRVNHIGFLRREYNETRRRDSDYRYQNVIVVEMALDTIVMEGFSDGSLTLAEEFNSAVDHGLRAQINKSGLTGPTYLDLAYVETDGTLVPELGWEPHNLYIPSVPSTIHYFIQRLEAVLDQVSRIDIDKTVAKLDTLLENANSVIVDVDAKQIQGEIVALISEISATNQRLQGILNSQGVTDLVNDLPQISKNTIDATGRLKQVLEDPGIDQTIQRLPAITASVDQAVVRFNELLNSPEIRQAVIELPQAIQSIERAAARVAEMAQGIQGLTSDQQEEIQAVVSNVRLLTERANTLMLKLQANPSGVIFASPPEDLDPAAP